MADTSHGAVAAGHHLAADAAAEVLAQGGNAVDAGVAGGIALGVVQSDYVNFAGVAPIMIRRPDGTALTIDGLGPWPAATDASVFERDHGGHVPKGILRTVVPAAPAAWIAALDEAGTMSFAEVAGPAIRLARDGFPMHWLMRGNIEKHRDGYASWPANARIYLPGGRVPDLGEAFVQTDLAATLQYMADEDAAAGGGSDGRAAARAAFYTGDIAQTICTYHAENGGWLGAKDMSAYRVDIGAPRCRDLRRRHRPVLPGLVPGPVPGPDHGPSGPVRLVGHRARIGGRASPGAGMRQAGLLGPRGCPGRPAPRRCSAGQAAVACPPGRTAGPV